MKETYAPRSQRVNERDLLNYTSKKKKVENKAKDMIEKTRNEREAMALLAFSDVDDTLIDHDYGVCVTVDVDTENNNKSVQDVGTANRYLYKMLELQNRYLYKMLELQNRYLYKMLELQNRYLYKMLELQNRYQPPVPKG
ncbi:unnamed protein product [Acanthoscelides obtectus]|uniref:Uncharacterized protein n=1 Tax=Acanthoscelides obtectus TaxID=200917 RepID=A0A9P0VUU3_ACAOB|nr:unnamed protein product [Acanthoscelides obtectus]CAK1685781.1 hypothetical protein AOBTE_LOCUS35613 [Acanthoscelides obtectus]